MVQAGLGKKQPPISKITRAKRAGGIEQAEQDLPSKHEALSSSSSRKRKKHSGFILKIG
jgi:hypothetical protein